MKKLIMSLFTLLVLGILLAVPAMAADIVESGTCGPDVTWTLDSDGVLTISGTGDMTSKPFPGYKDEVTSVIVEEGVTGIAEFSLGPFNYCKELSLPSTLTTIGKGAFMGDSSLTHVTIPDGVTEIQDSVFCECTKLVSVDLPPVVTSLGYEAFAYCGKLEQISLPEGLTEIGWGAFGGASSLKQITIPSTVTVMAGQALGGCTGLQEITFLGNAPAFAEDTFGNITATAYYPSANETWTEDVMQKHTGITWVGVRAAGTCGENLTWRLGMDGVLTIAGTGDMTNYVYLGTYAPWSGRTKYITSIVVQSGVTSIGNRAFADCQYATEISIPDTVTRIGYNAFYGCDALTNLYIPKSVSVIGSHITYSCSGLQGIWVDEENADFRSDEHGVLFSKDGTVLIQAPETILSYEIPEGVLTIGDNAFYSCYYLTDVTFPDGLERIGDNAFRGCHNLSSAQFGEGLLEIGDYAFYYAVEMTTLTFHDGVTSIGEYAFTLCENLTEVVIPEGITTINSSFTQCFRLERITIPASVTEIKNYAFSSCKVLTSYIFRGDAPTIGKDVFYVKATAYCPIGNATWNWDVQKTHQNRLSFRFYGELSGSCGDQGDNLTWKLDESGILTFSGSGGMMNYAAYTDVPWINAIYGIDGVSLPEGMTSIGNYAFYNCRRLVSAPLPTSLKEIGKSAFYYCSALTEITLPQGLNTISTNAFQTCTALTEIYIPDSVTDMQSYAFYNCIGLIKVRLSNSITTIPSGAFNNCQSLVIITIPAGITAIDYQAFRSCYDLRKLIFCGDAPKISSSAFGYLNATVYYPLNNETWTEDKLQAYGGKSVTWQSYIGCGDCGELVSWILDDAGTLKVWGTGAMYDYDTESSLPPWNICQDAIQKVTVEYGVTRIGENAFRSLTSVTEIDIAVYVKEIGNGALRDCTGLTAITVPVGTVTLGADAFRGCINAEQITLSYGLVSIGDSAFRDCAQAQALTFPTTLTQIGPAAFSGCSALTEMTFQADAPAMADDCFTGVTATAVYPVRNETWTEDVMLSYGGNITWVPDVVLPTLTPKYPTLSFETEVYYKVFFTVENGEDIVEMGLQTSPDSTLEDSDTMVPGYGYTEAAAMYDVRTEGIPAKNLGDDLWFRVYAKLTDGSYVYSKAYHYSALDYANNTLANSGNENLKSLCVAMLNYGAAAQLQLGYNTDNLMNAGLTEEQRALAKDYEPSMIDDLVGVDSDRVGSFAYNAAGYSARYPSVSFEGTFSINYFFQPALTVDSEMTLYYWDLDAYMSAEVLTAENALGSMTMTPQDDGTYAASYTGIAAREIGETIFVAGVYESDGTAYATGVLAYSLGAYCADQAESGTETMRAVAAATAVYGHYAEAYFG